MPVGQQPHRRRIIWLGCAHADRVCTSGSVIKLSGSSLPIPMLVTYPDVCWCQLISPSITGLRHYRSGCALLLGARSAHEHHDEAHDPRQSWSDTSPPISQAVPDLQSGSDDTHFVLPSSRETKPGTKLSRLNLSAPKTGKTLPARAKQPKFQAFGRAGGFCHGQRPQSSSTGHVLSDHKLYAHTFNHWLTRPPATPWMGGRHTRGQRGLAAVPEGGGGISIPQRSPT